MINEIDLTSLYKEVHTQASALFTRMCELRVHGLGNIYVIGNTMNQKALVVYLDCGPMHSRAGFEKEGYTVLTYEQMASGTRQHSSLDTEVLLAFLSFAVEANERLDSMHKVIRDLDNIPF